MLILVVDDKPDIEALFRQQFRRDIREGRFTMDLPHRNNAFKLITDAAGASLILILSDINMPRMTGLELLPKAKAAPPDVPVIMITAYGDTIRGEKPWKAEPRRFDQARRFCCASQRDRQPSRRGRSRGPLTGDSVPLMGDKLNVSGPYFVSRFGLPQSKNSF